MYRIYTKGPTPIQIKNKIDVLKQHYRYNRFWLYDDIFSKVDHKVCIYMDDKKYWISTHFGFHSIKLICIDNYECVTIFNKKNIYTFDHLRCWGNNIKCEFSKLKLIINYLKSIHMFKILNNFILVNDIIHYIKQIYMLLYNGYPIHVIFT